MPKMKTPQGRVVSVVDKGVEALLARGYTRLDDPTPAPVREVVNESAAAREAAEAAVAPDPEAPAQSAPKAEWVAFAHECGLTDAESLTKADIIERLA